MSWEVVLSSKLKNLNLYQMLYANAYNGLKKTKTKINIIFYKKPFNITKKSLP
jgi:hypothetical protein